MWITEDIPALYGLPPADQLWLIALAVEENGGPSEYVLVLRGLAERLEQLGWWLSEGEGTNEFCDEVPSTHA